MARAQMKRKHMIRLYHALFFCAVGPAFADDGRILPWHESELTGLAFSPDGSRMYSTSLRDDRVSRITAPNDSAESFGALLGRISGARSHAVAVSPNGRTIVIAGFQRTAMFEAESGKELWRIETPLQQYSPPFITALAFHPDGDQLAMSGSSSRVGGRHGYKGGLITIVDTQSGKQLRRFDDLSHASESIAFSPDGKLFAAGTNGAGGELPEPGELHVWDAATGKRLHRWKTRESVQAGENRVSASGIAFSPDSRTIAIASSDGTVRLWDVATASVRHTLNGHEREVRRVAFSPNGRWLASAGQDKTVRVWNIESGEQAARLDLTAVKINAMVFSPDGALLAVGGGDFLRSGEIRIWKIAGFLQ